MTVCTEGIFGASPIERGVSSPCYFRFSITESLGNYKLTVNETVVSLTSKFFLVKHGLVATISGTECTYLTPRVSAPLADYPKPENRMGRSLSTIEKSSVAGA